MSRDPLLWAARHGRWILVAGLVTGLAAPGLAAPLRPLLPFLVMVLLFLALLRVAPGALLGSLRALPRVGGTALLLQLALPLAIFGLAALAGLSDTPALLALLLVSAAPSIAGSPNIAMMLGAAPDHALRLMVVGTALMPLSVLVLFALLPALGEAGAVQGTALRLLGVIGLLALLAMALRRRIMPAPSPDQLARLDGASALALALFVVALMPAVSALALSDPAALAFWAALAFGFNLGAQALTWRLTRDRLPRDRALPLSVIAGNRNLALFLVSLPPETTAPILAFIGCYQLPMYLTPLLMGRFYGARRDGGRGDGPAQPTERRRRP